MIEEAEAKHIFRDETCFYVIAAIKNGDGGFIKFWKSKPSGGEWVDDIAKSKHYTTLGVASRELRNENGYLRYWGKVPLIQTHGDSVRFSVCHVRANVVVVEEEKFNVDRANAQERGT